MYNTSIVKASIIASSGVIGIFVTQLFGEWNNALFALVVLMGIDFVTGLLVAGLFQKSTKTFSGGLSSLACVKGIAKKVGTLFLVAVAYQADVLLQVDYLRTAVICALCASEILSIIENAGAMEILPEPVQRIFRRVIDALNRETINHEKEEQKNHRNDNNKGGD